MAIKRGFRRKTQFTPEKKCEENPQAIPISQVKRVKRETAPTSDSAQFILAWRSEDSVEKRKKPPKRSPAFFFFWIAKRSRNFLDCQASTGHGRSTLFLGSCFPKEACFPNLRAHVKFIHTKIPWNLENLNSTRNPQVR